MKIPEFIVRLTEISDCMDEACFNSAVFIMIYDAIICVSSSTVRDMTN
jgi:hypothetical protein